MTLKAWKLRPKRGGSAEAAGLHASRTGGAMRADIDANSRRLTRDTCGLPQLPLHQSADFFVRKALLVVGLGNELFVKQV